MFSCPEAVRLCVAAGATAALALALLSGAVHAADLPYADLGRPATPAEVKAWDIDVRPDFKGLPKGSGSVNQGADVWESRCASCHGIFGEANEVFSPLVGGTTKQDVATGRVARLTDPGFPGRTTLMKVSSLSTLWDYIQRAMPWNEPKSLAVDEVYAVTAYLLNLGGIVPADFVLSDTTMADAQALLPNRHGVRTDHAMWPGKGLPGTTARPDVQGTACMTNCAVSTDVASMLPDHARNNHGNLAEQNRGIGAQRGVDTTRPAGAAPLATAAAAPKPAAGGAAPALALAQKHACTACHGLDSRIVGPGFREIAKKYAGRDDAVTYLANRIQTGGSGTWGAVPMPPQALQAQDLRALAQWLADGAAR